LYFCDIVQWEIGLVGKGMGVSPMLAQVSTSRAAMLDGFPFQKKCSFSAALLLLEQYHNIILMLQKQLRPSDLLDKKKE
jgi:hypothetical protein